MPLKNEINLQKISLNQVVSIVILLLAVIIALKIYQGQNTKIAQIKFAQDEQKKKNDILLRVGDVKNRFDSYKKAYMPEDSRIIINAITEIAKSSGVKIIVLRPQEAPVSVARWGKEEKILEKSFFSLSIQADDYNKLGDFICKLDKDPMTFIIESISIRGSSVDRGRSLQGTEPETMLSVNLVIGKLFIKE